MLPTTKPAAPPEGSMMPRYRVSMDIGGTFTDVVFLGNIEVCTRVTEEMYGREVWQPGDARR